MRMQDFEHIHADICGSPEKDEVISEINLRMHCSYLDNYLSTVILIIIRFYDYKLQVQGY